MKSSPPRLPTARLFFRCGYLESVSQFIDPVGNAAVQTFALSVTNALLGGVTIKLAAD